MGKCIFCLCEETSNGGFTKEHIVPEAFGNEKLVIYDVCKICNSKLGQTIDAKISNSDYFSLVRSEKNIMGKNGIIKYNKKGRDENGDSYNVTNLSTFEKIPNLKENNGKITASCSSKEEGLVMLRKKLLRKGYTKEQINELVNTAVITKTKHNQFKVDIEFNLTDLALEALKISYECLYKAAGEEFINSEEGDRIRIILLKAMNKEQIDYEEIRNYMLLDENISNKVNCLLKQVRENEIECKNLVFVFSDETNIYVLIDLLGYNIEIIIRNELKKIIPEELYFA